MEEMFKENSTLTLILLSGSAKAHINSSKIYYTQSIKIYYYCKTKLTQTFTLMTRVKRVALWQGSSGLQALKLIRKIFLLTQEKT